MERHLDMQSSDTLKLNEIANDMRRWYENTDIDSQEVLGWYYRDLHLAQLKLNDVIEDVVGVSYVKLNIGNTDQEGGTGFSKLAYGFIDEYPETAVAGSIVSLDRVKVLHAPYDCWLPQEYYFGNGAIYFATRSLAGAIAEGSRLSIEPIENLPHYRSYEQSILVKPV